jgi:hypothetical protein
MLINFSSAQALAARGLKLTDSLSQTASLGFSATKNSPLLTKEPVRELATQVGVKLIDMILFFAELQS